MRCGLCALVGKRFKEREKGKKRADRERKKENGICCFMGLGGVKRLHNIFIFFITN